MSQSGRIRVSTVTEGKMFAKKMHRIVKKMQDKPVDSLDKLTEVNFLKSFVEIIYCVEWN